LLTVGHAVGKLIAWALLIAALPVAAEAPVTEMAKVITDSSLPSECLAPVEITSVDGVKQHVPSRGYLLEPGVHSVNGRVFLDTTKCRRSDGDLEIRKTADLVVDFEAGKTYYIAYDRGPMNPGDWKLLVWKVEGAATSEYRR
jgi:hypothetical protein